MGGHREAHPGADGEQHQERVERNEAAQGRAARGGGHEEGEEELLHCGRGRGGRWHGAGQSVGRNGHRPFSGPCPEEHHPQGLHNADRGPQEEGSSSQAWPTREGPHAAAAAGEDRE